MIRSKINRCSSLTLLLLSTIIGDVRSIAAANEAIDKHEDQPFWQFVLREFVFRTISSHQPDETLYAKILDAPFYGGPLAEASNDEDSLLSRGSVFRLADERWILCQENCETCQLCEKQKDPIVNWALRRIRRWTSEGVPKWDLQLTVLPQLDKIFSDGQPSRRLPDNYGYVMREDAPSSVKNLVSSTTDQPIVRKKILEKNVRLEGKTESRTPEMRRDDRTTRLSRVNDGIGRSSAVRPREYSRKMRSRNVSRSRRRQLDDRLIGRTDPLAFYYPQADNPTKISRDDAKPRLIIGIDQNGEKHLVHVVPINSPVENEEEIQHPSSYGRTYKRLYSPRISRMTQPIPNEDAYDKLIDRVLDSFSMNRNFIEAFLYSHKLVVEKPKKSAVSSYSSYSRMVDDDDDDDGRFQTRNDDSRVRGLSIHRANIYPMESEYRVNENDRQSRRYTEETAKDVNRLADVYQDQSSITEYDPYNVSSNDQRNDDRSVPQVDTERKRRDSPNEQTHSSSESGPRGFGQNHRDVNDTAFPANRGNSQTT